MKKLAIIITHPIQYYAPLFKLLSERQHIQINVFYTWEQSKDRVFDKKFGKEIKWDIPLLDGYDYTFAKNISKNPGSGTFKGVINPTLIKEIEQWGADAILVFGWNHQSHLKAIRYFKGKVPVYFRGDSTLLDEKRGIKTLLRRIWLKFIYRYIDHAFYVGQNNKAYFIKHGLKKDQLIFAPHAIDNDRFYDKTGDYSKKADQWKQKLGFSDKDIVFLFVGKFESKKNPLLLIKAASLLPQYKFLFVGNGDLEDEMKDKAGKNVLFLPFQNQSLMPVIYRIGNIFVLPSKGPGETWGLVVNEAMACSKAVLVSNKVGCAVNLAENGKTGYIFDSVSIDSLLEKIKLISEKHERFGENSASVIKNWSFLNIINSIENHLI